jgi:proteasome lid subunit RPN8/RPN11
LTLFIVREVLDDIRSHAEVTYPEECCGLLVARETASGGPERQARRTVTESIRMNNVYDGPKHSRYNIEPLEFYKADRVISQKGLTIAGIYHSHPDHSASCSMFDLEHSFPWYSYVIISVPKGRVGDIKSWTPREDHKSAIQEEIEILEP